MVPRTAVAAALLVGLPAFAQGLDQRPANPTCLAPARPQSEGLRVQLDPLIPAVSLSYPVAIEQSPVDPARWYVAELGGDVQLLRGDLGSKARAMSLRDRVAQVGEGGLLGLALDPQFASNGELYLYYTTAGPSEAVPLVSVVSRFFSRDGGQSFDPASEQVLLRVDQPSLIHKAGDIHFGPDGFLYISLGDGGHSDTGQDPTDLLGSLLRIDVNGGAPYSIPPDNPFALGGAGAPEVWAWGFRNPYRWTFDPLTGELWAADVGQAAWEEIDLVHGGENYGWPIREGAHCYPQGPCATGGLVDPVVEYSHEAGCAVIGGPVYRGHALPALAGAVLLSDYCSARIRAALPGADGGRTLVDLYSSPATTVGFGQDADGEVLVLRVDGVFRIVPSTAPEPPPFPQALSQTGCVDPREPSRPAAGLIPYDVIEPLWSDGAEKQRWLALPDAARIHVEPDGDLTLPIGSVAMKSFSLGGRLVETRLFMRHEDGGWAGYTYAWNDAQTDAFLLAGAEQRPVGGQTWTFPSREQCMNCHTSAAGYTLGLEVLQLNRDFRYPATGRSSNQLETFEHIGLLDAPLAKPPRELPLLSRASGDASARSYLHANCGGCHRQFGPVWTPELTFSIPSASLRNVCDWPPYFGDLGVVGARILAPGDPSHSLLSLRPHLVGPGQMPPLARTTVDQDGVQRIDRWIESWTSCAGPDADGDGIVDADDNCPDTPNPDQKDANRNHIGDVCETACNDGIDNDGDGRVDYPRDPSCSRPSDDTENLTPVIDTVGPIVADEGVTLSFPIAAHDPEGEALAFELSPLPAGAVLSPQGVLTWRPELDQVGCGGTKSIPLTLAVTDPQGGHASAPLVLEVRDTPTGSAPRLEAIPDATIGSGTPIELRLQASDADGDAITLSAGELPAGATFASDGVFRWTPGLPQVGPHPLVFAARDCTGESSSETVTIDVRPAPPRLTALVQASGWKRDRVAIDGVNFAGKLKVFFGDHRAKVEAASDTHLVVRVPRMKHKAAAVAVTVVRDGVASENSLPFQYVEPVARR